MVFMLTGTNLDAPDANALAGFTAGCWGGTVEVDKPGRVVLAAPGGGRRIR